jgi:hypothetical protein
MKTVAVIAIFIAAGLATPFAVFRADNSYWMPIVLAGVLVICMIALIPGRKERERRARALHD